MLILLLPFLILSLSQARPPPESCVAIHLVIMLPSEKESCRDYGHAGIGIGERFYDFGPSRKNVLLRVLGNRAEPHWDNAVDEKRDASYGQMLRFIRDTWSCPVKIVTAQITQDQEAGLVDYWERLYQNPGLFSFSFGRVCTSMVYKSLRKTKLLPFGMTPYRVQSLLRRATSQLHDTCGKFKNQPAIVSDFIK